MTDHTGDLLIQQIRQFQENKNHILSMQAEQLEDEQRARKSLNAYLREQSSLIQNLKFTFSLEVAAIRQELAACRHDYRCALKRERAALISSY